MFEFEKNDVKTARKWFEMGCKAEKPQEKLEYYSKALKIDPNHISAWNNKGVALRLLGKFEKAIECFDKALKIGPKLGILWNNKGVALRLLGKFEKAIECFDKALKIDPKDKLALKNREIVMDKIVELKIPDNKTNPSS